jgi:alpha-glucosidase
MSRLLRISTFLCLLFTAHLLHAQQYKLQSPDGKISVQIDLKEKITFTVKHENDVIVAPSPISMKISEGGDFGVNPKVKKATPSRVDQIIDAPIYRRSKIRDQFNQLTLTFKGDYAVVFRAYNEGTAYRFQSSRKSDYNVVGEEVSLNFERDHHAYMPYVNKEANASFEDQFWNSFENTYIQAPLSKFDAKRLAFLPILVDVGNGKKVCITEADLEDYPGLYMNNPDGSKRLSGVFAAYPKEMEKGGHNMLQEIVRAREPFIAKAKGTRNFPWRVFAISSEDKQLADNDLVYKLASPSRLKDISWIKPGKVAWDWWNDWNIYGVNFKSGVNTETYKYYIDFAHEQGIEYVILDEGWAVNLKVDLMQIVPEIDLKSIIDYAKQKNVGIILWAGYNAFNRDIEGVCRHYAEMGVKGFKVDFMDRDDQEMVRFYYRASEIAAKYNMLLDFHGAYKPTGLNRTYPNVINFEGVHGLEQMKWSPPSVDQVTYDVTIPFIRMLAGPLDYTQGAMRNATRSNYRPVNSEPMSQGTRCRQLAQYIIFESPLNMLCDNPSAYRQEKECTAFIASVPTVWDQTNVLQGKVGEYIMTARQKGDSWYVGGLTNWDARTADVDLSFLPAGNYSLEVFRDGVNADRIARDFVHEMDALSADRKLKIQMAPGGGFVVKLTPSK